jgi:hypothetical protein
MQPLVPLAGSASLGHKRQRSIFREMPFSAIFDPGMALKLIRLHFVKDEVIAA